MSRWTSCVVGAVLAVGGYVVGVSTAPSNVLPAAHADAYWDASRDAYVTGDIENLCFWKVDRVTKKVTEATYYRVIYDDLLGPDGRWQTDWSNSFVVTGTAKVDPTRAPANREGGDAGPGGGEAPKVPDKPQPPEGGGGKSCG